jgi:hypothetical protein
MKAYLLITGLIFALVVVAHVVRLVQEGAQVSHDPWFLGLTLLAAGLSVWAFRLLARLPGPQH